MDSECVFCHARRMANSSYCRIHGCHQCGGIKRNGTCLYQFCHRYAKGGSLTRNSRCMFIDAYDNNKECCNKRNGSSYCDDHVCELCRVCHNPAFGSGCNNCDAWCMTTGRKHRYKECANYHPKRWRFGRSKPSRDEIKRTYRFPSSPVMTINYMGLYR